MNIHPERRGWGAFGAYTLSGELPREQALAVLEARIAETEDRPDLTPRERVKALAKLRLQWTTAARQVYTDLQPWETVFVARHPRRPLVRDYIHHIVQDFCELHGDRVFGDDAAIVTGFGSIADHPVLIVGHADA